MEHDELTDVLHALPRWPGDHVDPCYGKPVGPGYADRVNALGDVGEIRSCFEFGGHFGYGLVTWLHAFPEITWAGWSDNEGAFAGSNAACEENVRAYLKWRDRRCKVWFTERPIKAAGFQVDLVMVDGDHARDAALVDLTLAFAMRPKVVLVDDMHLGGVLDACDAFKHYTGHEYELNMQIAAGTAIFRP